SGRRACASGRAQHSSEEQYRRSSRARGGVVHYAVSVIGSQGAKRSAQFLGEELGLLPGGEVVALVDLVEVDEVGVGLLGPATGRLIELVREHADSGWDLDVLDVEEAERVLPVKTSRGHSGVRHPGERDVVEDLVSREVADRVSFEGPDDVLVTARVVVEHPGGEGDGRIGKSVQRLRA